MTAIKVKDFKKSYGSNAVLKGISFEVEQGEIFAILGSNGAGKTTLLECIERLKEYNSGSIELDEKSIGVQLQSSSLPSNIKVGEAIKLFSVWNNGNAHDLQTRYGLGELSKKQYKELSTGQKRRLHLALAMVSSPNIIFLDEPTAGLDVEARASLHAEIKELKKQGKTIILASHDMAEVESLCDRLIMLRAGEIAFCGNIQAFTAMQVGRYKIHIKTETTGEYSVKEVDNIHKGLTEILEQNKNIVDIKIERPSLEDSFLAIAKNGGKI